MILSSLSETNRLNASARRFTLGQASRPDILSIEEMFARAAREVGDDDPADPRLHEPHKYRSVFISDIHLGTRACCAGNLVKFLDHIRTDYLFILGDFFDCWQMGGLDLFEIYKMSPAQITVLTKIRKLNRKGAKVIFIPGNHDEIFRDKLSRSATYGDMAICFDATHDTADGKRLLLMHGDSFDEIVRGHRWLGVLGTRAYEKLAQVSIGIDRWRADIRVNRIFEMLGLQKHWSLAHAIRSASDGASYTASYEKAMLTHFSARNMEIAAWNKGRDAASQIKPYDALICGHTHIAVAKTFDLSPEKTNGLNAPTHMDFFNTGAWVGRPTSNTDAEANARQDETKHPTCTAVVERIDGSLQHLKWDIQRGIIDMTDRDDNGVFISAHDSEARRPAPQEPVIAVSRPRTA